MSVPRASMSVAIPASKSPKEGKTLSNTDKTVPYGKDPNAPKRPLSAYVMYTTAHRSV